MHFSAGLSIFYSFFKGGVSIPAAFVLLIILAAILFWAWLSPHYDEFGSNGAVISALVIIFCIVIALFCTVRIPAGYVGVIYNMNGGVAETTLSQGFHLVKPTHKVTTYTIGIEQSYLTSGSDGDSKGDESFEVPSNDGKGLTVDMTFTYRFDPDQVADTFTRFKGQSGKDVKEIFIKPNIMSWTKEVTAKYSVIDLLGDQRASLNSELTAYLKDKFEPYGIIIESVSLINIDPDDETRAAVQKKVNAQQDLELAKIEQQTANVNAEKEKEVAITKANQEKETAQINAEAKLIEAQAQADANRLISQSLTPELIQQQMYEKWNGQLPTVQSGSDTPIIVDTTN